LAFKEIDPVSVLHLPSGGAQHLVDLDPGFGFWREVLHGVTAH
jgi:hypothetical protein